MVVDTSALVAIVAGEPESERLNRCLSGEAHVFLSTGTAVETYIVARAKWGQAGIDRLEQLLAAVDMRFQSVDERQMRLAVEAFARFGRGSGHPAKLNYGDCFAYALARSLDAPLLFKGGDFGHTDVRPALRASR